MKKLFKKIRITAVCLAALLLFSALSMPMLGCSNEKPIGEDNTSATAVDLDYSKYSATMLYDVMSKLSAKTHMGQTVKIRGDFGAVYNFATNSYINVIEQYDATACCAAYYEVRLADGVDRPAIGSRIEMVGVFEANYIKITAITLFKGKIDNTVPEIDAANMSKSELNTFLSTIKSTTNQYTGKTVRICGHYGSSNGLSFVVGYKENALTNKLESDWSYELHSSTVEFPKVTDNSLRAYEIIGTVSSYTDADGKAWPCIEVTSIRSITTYSLTA